MNTQAPFLSGKNRYPVSMLIKPVSGSCNMRCSYCFYCDETQKRTTQSFGSMSLETAENLIKKTLDGSFSLCTYAFQGGEPTLRGLDFYRSFVELTQKYNTHHTQVHFAIQTNGTLIDNEWAQFFAQNGFLVGLSMDGGKRIHDALRFDSTGNGTFNKVLRASQLFNNYNVAYNILTVVSAVVAEHIQDIYEFYIRNNFIYQQYIACLDPIGETRGQYAWSLTPERYGVFLKKLFDLWYRSFKRGKQVSVRYFDNLVLMLLGRPPESCGMLGHCTFQHVVEADGSTYPCDFYVLDAYKLGNINTDSFADIEAVRIKIGFIEKSQYVDPECSKCRWASLCRGGCRRDRDDFSGGKLHKNYFCTAYKDFFDYAYERLTEIAGIIARANLS